MSHPKMNMFDCSSILQEALTITMSVLKKRERLEDKTTTGKRKHEEAGAEVTAMTAGVEKRQRQVKHLLFHVSKRRGLDKRQMKSLAQAVGERQEDADNFQDLELQVEACALTLTNGQKLSEPMIKKSMDKLRNDSSWPRSKTTSGKRFKQMAKAEQKSKVPICGVKGCDEIVNLNNYDKKPFRICRDHFLKMKLQGVVLQMDAGDTMKWIHKEADESATTGLTSRHRRIAAQEAALEDKNDSQASQGQTMMTFRTPDGKIESASLDARTVNIITKYKASGARLAEPEEIPDTRSQVGDLLAIEL